MADDLLGTLVLDRDEAGVERLFGSDPELRFDRVAMMASAYFHVPVAMIALVRGDRVWLKSAHGFEGREGPLAGTLTEVAFAQGPLYVIEDASRDPRWSDHPMVTGPLHLRFYAGKVLRTQGGTPIGVLAIGAPEPRTFSERDARDLGLIARWVEDEISREEEGARAEAVQRALLPRAGLVVPGYRVAGACQPSREVGGDFYDWYPTHDGITFTLADVMGKGVGAAIIAASVRAVLRGANSGRSVASAVQRAAALLDEDLSGTSSFVTAFHARLRAVDGSVRYVDAGHGLSLIVRADGETERLASLDFPLGTTLVERWRSEERWLAPGDTIVTFSDGVLDLFDGTLETTLAEVEDLVRSVGDPEALVAALTAPARARHDVDDVTVVAIRRDPA
jgi:hypothetical protein